KKPYRLASRVGMSLALHCTSIGKAVLASLPDEEVRKVARRTGMPRRTPNTITDPDRLLDELATVRARGWAEDHEENEIGVCASGAAVVDHTGEVIGGISAVALAHEATGSDERLGREVVRAARAVSRALGSPSEV
ncbi:IclR family transcriptional regulator, partial [Glycomyces tenuis]|uniref:IclR family transcriptional regulator n=1 Tax=Glycomyces tenuis TaxID=58116 RepID=UPI0024A84C98